MLGRTPGCYLERSSLDKMVQRWLRGQVSFALRKCNWRENALCRPTPLPVALVTLSALAWREGAPGCIRILGGMLGFRFSKKSYHCLDLLPIAGTSCIIANNITEQLAASD